MNKITSILDLSAITMLAIALTLVISGFRTLSEDVHFISESLKKGSICTIAMAPDEFLKTNKNLINYKAMELAKKRCGK